MNQNGMTSWSLLPVVSALLKRYNAYTTLTSINSNVESVAMVSAFPIPFNNELTISINTELPLKEAKLVLTNSLGQELKQLQNLKLETGINSIKMYDLNELSTGVYFISVFENAEKIKTIKIIK